MYHFVFDNDVLGCCEDFCIRFSLYHLPNFFSPYILSGKTLRSYNEEFGIYNDITSLQTGAVIG